MKEYRRLTSFHNIDNAKELQRQLDYMHIDNVIETGFDFMTQADEYRVYFKCDQKDWLNAFDAIYDQMMALREKDEAEAKAYVESQTIISEDEVGAASIELNDMLYDVARKYTSFTEEVTINRTLNNDPQEDETAYVNFNLNLDDLTSFEGSFARKGNQAISVIDLNNPKELFDSSACIKLDDEANDLNNTHVSYDIEEEIYDDGKEFKQVCKLIVYDFVKKAKGKIIDGFEVGFKKSGNQLFCVLTKQSVVR